MARPKGKLLALVLVFGAITVVTATGAFTTVEAERTAEVNVTGDANALLGLTEYEDSDGDTPYARTTDDGQIVMVLGENMSTGQGASGINANANTTIQNAINVTNQGNQEVDVTLSVQDSEGNSVNGINMIWSDGSTGSKALSSGTTETFGIEINLLGAASDGDLDDLTIVINASAN
ncbi:hypothetical protein SAMN05192561_101531 [Halopenitus malekzadehii]|uniref:Uncharacterized protein n=1 Tax=Halopenitus malekzadehii TaxID=1267564 RepID=A0A1H6HUS8_9EURY|nr:hypothetical protein [Halopenitus malekzadehii]SEH39658.1 hypothetical protein SAMN05192561_101531 [Halopenitus malekzadehii]